MIKKTRNFLLLMGVFFSMGNVHCQSARALFNAGNGITFESNLGEAGGPLKNISAKKLNSEFTGISYSIFKEMENSVLKKVSPKTTFSTGDRIRVAVQVNKKGYLSVVNIDPEGKATLISMKAAIPGNFINVPDKGFLKFVGAKGIEQLIFVLSAKPLPQFENPTPKIVSYFATACNSAASRSIMIDDSTENKFNLVNTNGTCAVNNGSTRSLVVEVADDSGFGVVSDSILASGQIMTLKINLHHE
jgi:hypothetical protein